mgnify:CR=1 FL=1
MMGNAFYPDEWLDSAYDIPYEQFYQKGMRGIIFDIDNTLVPHGAPADERAVQLFERLRAIGFHTCLLSNNKEARVAPFAGQIGSDYIYKGRKPIEHPRFNEITSLWKSGAITATEAMKRLDMKPSTFYRKVKQI